jgi:hypothetical protein
MISSGNAACNRWIWQAPDTTRRSRARPWTDIAVPHREARLSHRALIVVALWGVSPRWNRPRLIEAGALPSSPGQPPSGETSDFPSSHTKPCGSASFLVPNICAPPAGAQSIFDGSPYDITFADVRAARLCFWRRLGSECQGKAAAHANSAENQTIETAIIATDTRDGSFDLILPHLESDGCEHHKSACQN